ncbi:unnamed protein product [Calypogeia fissa]
MSPSGQHATRVPWRIYGNCSKLPTKAKSHCCPKNRPKYRSQRFTVQTTKGAAAALQLFNVRSHVRQGNDSTEF